MSTSRTPRPIAPENTLAGLVDSRYSRGRQSHDYHAIYKRHNETLRIAIHRDSSDFQSYARIEIYDPTQKRWNPLGHIPYRRMAVHQQKRTQHGSIDAVSYVADLSPEGRALFEQDTAELLRQAAIILEP